MKLIALAAAAVLTLCAQASAQTADRSLRIVMLDADGGAATLFVTPEGKSLLVDTGWPTGMPQAKPAADGTPAPPPPGATIGRLESAMKRLGLRRIDHLLITHYHFDHVGGIHDILARIPVGTVIDHGPNREEMSAEQAASPSPNHPVRLYARYEAALAGRKRRVVQPGDRIALGSMTMTIVAGDGMPIARPLPGAGGRTAGCEGPDRPSRDDENARSLGFVATFGKARILDLGDLTWVGEKRLVCPIDKLGRIDVLLVSHHGAESSNSPPLIAATAPRVALVGNGARKGGDASVFATLSAAESKPAIWYGHFATRSPEANPKPDRIANLAAPTDGAHELDVLVSRNGAVRVTNRRNGYTESYPPR